MLTMTEADIVSSFFQAVFGRHDGQFLRLVYIDANRKPTQRFHALPQGLAKVAELTAANRDYANCYFGSNPYKVAGKGDKEFVADELTHLHADLDKCDPKTLLVQPSILIESSPGKYQALWLLDKPYPRDQVEEVNARIAKHHGIDDCWDAGHLLRVPTSINHKADYNKPEVKLLYINRTRLQLDDVLAQYNNPVPMSFRVANAPMPEPEELEQAEEIIRRYRSDGLPFSFPEMYQLVPEKDQSGHHWHIIKMCVEAEMTREETFSVALAAPSNHYRRDGRPDSELWKSLGKLYTETSQVEESQPEPEVASFMIYGPEDHAEPIPPMEWLIKNIWPKGSYGPLAGAKKSFKSYVAILMAVAIGTGKPFLGEFEVRTPGPVFYFVGEGGYDSWRRRFQRVCKAYGVDPRETNVYATPYLAPVDSKKFAEMVKASTELGPVARFLDPIYAYHPQGIEAQNLYDRGRMLANLHQLTADAALIIPDHYRKNGNEKLDLDEIGQSGMAQWADSWILQAHRKPYDFDTGTAFLEIEFGSREGYARRKFLDLTVGTVNEESGDHEGEITWELGTHTGVSKTSNGAEVHNDITLHARLSKLLDNPKYKIEANRTFTQAVGVSMLRDIFKIGKSAAYSRWNQLISNGTIVETGKKNSFRIGDGPA